VAELNEDLAELAELSDKAGEMDAEAEDEDLAELAAKLAEREDKVEEFKSRLDKLEGLDAEVEDEDLTELAAELVTLRSVR